MLDRPPRTAPRAACCLGVVVALLAGMMVITATVLPVPEASAIGIGTIQARVFDHLGVNYGTTGNGITYKPVGSGSSSALVSAPNEALTAHGYSGSCPRR